MKRLLLMLCLLAAACSSGGEEAGSDDSSGIPELCPGLGPVEVSHSGPLDVGGRQSLSVEVTEEMISYESSSSPPSRGLYKVQVYPAQDKMVVSSKISVDPLQAREIKKGEKGYTANCNDMVRGIELLRNRTNGTESEQVDAAFVCLKNII